MDMFLTVIGALNEGFLQTLKLFAITLIGMPCPWALIISFGSMSRFTPSFASTYPAGGVDHRGTPLMLQLLILFFVPGIVLRAAVPGPAESPGGSWPLPSRLSSTTPVISRRSTGAVSRGPCGTAGGRTGAGHDQVSDLFPCHPAADGEAHRPPMSNEIITLVQRIPLWLVSSPCRRLFGPVRPL